MASHTASDLSVLVFSQYVELPDVIQQIAEANNWSDEIAKQQLLNLQLPSLMPVWVGDPPDFFSASSPMQKPLECFLNPTCPDAYSYEIQDFAHNYEFYWSIPTLVGWCKRRQIAVPDKWSGWMNKEYLELRDRDLIPEASPQAADRSFGERWAEVQAIYEEECRLRGKRGAQTRTGKKMGISRQRVGQILKAQASKKS